jgi:hypothetical protein
MTAAMTSPLGGQRSGSGYAPFNEQVTFHLVIRQLRRAKDMALMGYDDIESFINAAELRINVRNRTLVVRPDRCGVPCVQRSCNAAAASSRQNQRGQRSEAPDPTLLRHIQRTKPRVANLQQAGATRAPLGSLARPGQWVAEVVDDFDVVSDSSGPRPACFRHGGRP